MWIFLKLVNIVECFVYIVDIKFFILEGGMRIDVISKFLKMYVRFGVRNNKSMCFWLLIIFNCIVYYKIK